MDGEEFLRLMWYIGGALALVGLAICLHDYFCPDDDDTEE